jgi:general secretion pathway protein J
VRPGNRRGFTLIEVLLALAILSILLTMVYGSFDQTSRLAGHVDAVSDRYRTARITLVKMTDEIMSSFYFPDKDSITYFRGGEGVSRHGLDADTLAFSTRTRAVLPGQVASTLNAVEYLLQDDGNLVHIETLNPLGFSAENTQRYPLAEGLSGFRLRYLEAESGEWLDGWDAQGHGGKLPRAVEVTLFFPGTLGDGFDADSGNVDPAEPLPFTTVIPVPMGAV